MVQGLLVFFDDYVLVLFFFFCKFSFFMEEKVWKFINSSIKKSCILDFMLIFLVIDCMDVFLLIIMKMINLLFEFGLFVDDWKCVFVFLFLKKFGLDFLFKNYRFVSNLQYVLKLIEKMVFEQIYIYMMIYLLYFEFQFVYCKNYSMEMVFVRVMNDIFMKMNI